MPENGLIEYRWEGAYVLNTNRNQHISIAIDAHTGEGTCIHIAIGDEVGQTDLFCSFRLQGDLWRRGISIPNIIESGLSNTLETPRQDHTFAAGPGVLETTI